MTSDDAQLFVDLAAGLDRDLAPLSKDKRAQAVSDLIQRSHVAYAVWRVAEGYRLRRLKFVELVSLIPRRHPGS